MGFPDDLKYSREHEWVRMEGNRVVVGITDYAQREMGEVVYVELPEVGSEVEQTETFGTVESVKAVSDLFDTVFVTDLNHENIGQLKFGNTIVDGALNEKIIQQVDVACITGSSIVNGALFQLLEWCKKYGVHPVLYGVTVKGAANLLGFEVFCPFCRNETVLPMEIY